MKSVINKIYNMRLMAAGDSIIEKYESGVIGKVRTKTDMETEMEMILDTIMDLMHFCGVEGLDKNIAPFFRKAKQT